MGFSFIHNFLPRANMFLLLSIFALGILTGCSSKYVFEEQHIIGNQLWAYSDILNYEPTIKDTSTIYNIYLEVEHSTNYSNQNLYTRIKTTFPSKEVLTEVVSLELADKRGKWNGSCSGEWCRVQIPLQEGAYFSQSGNYLFEIEQFMRTNPIEGIKSISLMLEDTQQKR